MKSTGVVLAFLLGVVAIAHADDITTTAGQVYSNAKISRADPLGVNITHKSGVTRVLFSEMSEADRKKYGYDPQKEEAFLLQERQLAVQKEARKVEIARQEEARRDLFKPSDISVAAFHATRPKDVTVFLAEAQLDDYFNYDFSDSDNPRAKDIYWSVKIKTHEGTRIGNGYIRKEGRGAALFELIKDGKCHSIVARVRHPPQSQDSNIFFLEDFQEAPALWMRSSPNNAPRLQTKNGEVYERFRLMRREGQSVVISHATGISAIPLSELTDDSLIILGLDPEKERKYADQQAALQRKAEEVAAARQLMLANTESYYGVILQMVDGGALMINSTAHRLQEMGRSTMGRNTEPVFIEGDFNGYVDESEWHGRIYSSGTYKYTIVSGATKTTKRYKIEE